VGIGARVFAAVVLSLAAVECGLQAHDPGMVPVHAPAFRGAPDSGVALSPGRATGSGNSAEDLRAAKGRAETVNAGLESRVEARTAELQRSTEQLRSENRAARANRNRSCCARAQARIGPD
jgi:hypothetical protein